MDEVELSRIASITSGNMFFFENGLNGQICMMRYAICDKVEEQIMKE